MDRLCIDSGRWRRWSSEGQVAVILNAVETANYVTLDAIVRIISYFFGIGFVTSHELHCTGAWADRVVLSQVFFILQTKVGFK